MSFKAYTHILGELYEWWRTSERERDIGVSFFLSRGDHCSNVILVFTAFLLDKQKHTNITTQISIIPGRFHQHKTQIKSSAQSKVFVLAQLYVTNLHLYTSKKALVKYYKFCFLGYITYLQKLGHSRFSPFTFFCCRYSTFGKRNSIIQTSMRAQWYSTNVCVLLAGDCHTLWTLITGVVLAEARGRSRITIVHVWLTQTHNYTKTTADDSSSTGICSFLCVFLVCFFEKPLWLPVPPPAPY